MKPRILGVLAVIIIALMAIVLMANLDNLPRQVRASAENAQKTLVSERNQFNGDRAYVLKAISADPDLFRTQAAVWQSKLSDADSRLRKAESEMQGVSTILKQ